MTDICGNCLDAGWVCENHRDRPWGGMVASPTACECGAGSPCPVCHSAMANADLIHALESELAEVEEDIRWAADGELARLISRRERMTTALKARHTQAGDDSNG